MCSVILHSLAVYITYLCTCTCSSMEPLFESPKLDDDLRALVRQTFPEFYPQGMYSKNLLVYKMLASAL